MASLSHPNIAAVRDFGLCFEFTMLVAWAEADVPLSLMASNGAEALDVLETAGELPGVILLDMLMPIMNGWQFRRAQLKDARFSSIPVVVLTGGMFAEEAAESMRVSAWLTKPADADSLLAALALVRHPGSS
jgi:CheY-like chemotaxis protein